MLSIKTKVQGLSRAQWLGTSIALLEGWSLENPAPTSDDSQMLITPSDPMSLFGFCGYLQRRTLSYIHICSHTWIRQNVSFKKTTNKWTLRFRQCLQLFLCKYIVQIHFLKIFLNVLKALIINLIITYILKLNLKAFHYSYSKFKQFICS